MNDNTVPVAYTFDDVQLVPRFSDVESRSDVDLSTRFTKNFYIRTPLVAAPMDTVCGSDMAIALYDLGGVGIIHRYDSIETQCNNVKTLVSHIANINYKYGKTTSPILTTNDVVAAAIGATNDYKERAIELLKAGATVLVIDVAHGHHLHVHHAMTTLTYLKASYKFDIILGSIATPEAAIFGISLGADALRVGVGGGSVCETRIRTGIGIPQLSAVKNIVDSINRSKVSDNRYSYESNAEKYNIPIISDGGIRYPGDAAKALAAGAESVMLGNLFSGTNEAPGDTIIGGQWPHVKEWKVYRGMASATTKLKYAGEVAHVEGASKIIEAKGPVKDVFNDICDGIKSSMSYVGAHNLKTFVNNAQFIRITPAGLAEAHPHLLR